MAIVEKTEVEFPSKDGRTTVHGLVWHGGERPKAIIQVIHGMAEHVQRYDDFACFLVDQGYAVCGHDHVGHGKSVTSKDEWGHIPLKDGKEILIADVHTMRFKAQDLLAADGESSPIPHVMLGHSMGSFVLRCYLARHGEGLSGAIISGTGNMPMGTSKAGNALARGIARLRGETYRSKLVDGMGAGGYGKQIKGAKTPLDWLSHNTSNVKRYIADERCGFMFTVGGYAAVTSLTAECATAECVAAYPKKLPLLYIAGAEDPVGDFGKGVRQAFELASGSGIEDVTLKIYENMRHEVLNEDDRQVVYGDIESWLEERV